MAKSRCFIRTNIPLSMNIGIHWYNHSHHIRRVFFFARKVPSVKELDIYSLECIMNLRVLAEWKLGRHLWSIKERFRLKRNDFC